MDRINDRISTEDNAQITLDYIVGISIFLISVFFVFMFMNNLFIPFQSTSDETTLAADKTSVILVERLLAEDKSVALNVINQTSLYYFNNTKLNYSDQTQYNNTLNEVGLYSRERSYSFNLSVSDLNENIINQSGPVLPQYSDIAQTKRFVIVKNPLTGNVTEAILSVRVW